MSKKYRKGKPIHSLDALSEELNAGRWVFFREKVLHPGFVLSMQFRTIDFGVRAGFFRYAKELAPSELEKV